jgi:Holliday junction resolvase-like predicted endonuclease
MAGSFGRFHLPTTRLWQRPIALLRPKAAKLDGEKMSMRLLARQRLEVLDKESRRFMGRLRFIMRERRTLDFRPRLAAMEVRSKECRNGGCTRVTSGCDR